jgi:hypothetical protein
VKSGVTLQPGQGRDAPRLARPRRLSDDADPDRRHRDALAGGAGQRLQAKERGHHGEGTIDGDGKVFWDSYWTLRKDYVPRGLRWASDYDARRPRLVQVFDSKTSRSAAAC